VYKKRLAKMSDHKKIRIIIADDHDVYRIGLKEIFREQPNYSVVSEADDGNSLLNELSHTPADIVLTDINMPQMDGIAACSLIKKQFPHTGVIAISKSNEFYRVSQMLEAGAKGYIVKSVDKEEILRAVYAVYIGHYYYCNSAMAGLPDISSIIKSNRGRMPTQPLLNEKEISIIRMICDEFSAKEISDKLLQSPRTVEGSRTKIIEKLRVKNIAGVVKYAIRNGIYFLD
jgi:DNA-binding NarL/FixJ family response regulator